MSDTRALLKAMAEIPGSPAAIAIFSWIQKQVFRLFRLLTDWLLQDLQGDQTCL